jgi:hypothetical protein
MKIYEIVNPAPAATVEPQVATPQATLPAEPEPTPQDIETVQGLLGTIDVKTERPQTLLNKLTGWMKEYPMLDKVTDLIPQTRLIKAIAAAADAIEAGDPKTALASLASGLTGNVGKVVQQANQLVNVGSNLAQGNLQGAALAVGGNVATAAKGIQAANTLAQGGTVQQAAQQIGGTVAKVAKGAEFVQNKLAPTAQPTATAQAPDADVELARIKKLAAV